MALLTSIRPTSVGVAVTGTAVSASDTIAAADLGTNGAFLVVINAGGSPDTVAILDGGSTPAGNAGVSAGGSVTNATTKVFFISPKMINPSTLVVTVTHSFLTTVTCNLYPIG